VSSSIPSGHSRLEADARCKCDRQFPCQQCVERNHPELCRPFDDTAQEEDELKQRLVRVERVLQGVLAREKARDKERAEHSSTPRPGPSLSLSDEPCSPVVGRRIPLLTEDAGSGEADGSWFGPNALPSVNSALLQRARYYDTQCISVAIHKNLHPRSVHRYVRTIPPPVATSRYPSSRIDLKFGMNSSKSAPSFPTGKTATDSSTYIFEKSTGSVSPSTKLLSGATTLASWLASVTVTSNPTPTLSPSSLLYSLPLPIAFLEVQPRTTRQNASTKHVSDTPRVAIG
jgi:hypothetical protein